MPWELNGLYHENSLPTLAVLTLRRVRGSPETGNPTKFRAEIGHSSLRFLCEAASFPGMNRIPSLDGLRAISISLVVAGHWAELRYHSDIAGAFANLGVRIFFIISGFLITTLLLKEREKTSTIALRGF